MILQLGFKFSTVNSFVLKKLYKKRRLFFKATRVMLFPTKKIVGCHSPEAKTSSIHLPVGLISNSLPPPPSSVRSRGRTLTSQPKFLGWIDNQIFLAMDNLMTLTAQPLNWFDSYSDKRGLI